MWGAEAVIDSTVQAFFALILAWMLYRGKHRLWILGLALLPSVMDSDHLLPLYSEGIKAFHSLIFAYTLAGIPLIYGYAKDSDESKKLGISIFAILIMGMATDLLEGGKIAFMYPFSAQAYALPYFGAYQISRIGTIVLVMIVIAGAYSYERSLSEIPAQHPKPHSPYHHHAHHSFYRHASAGSEAMFRVTALLASLIIYITMFIIISR